MLIEKLDVLMPVPVLSLPCDTLSSNALSFHQIVTEHPLCALSKPQNEAQNSHRANGWVRGKICILIIIRTDIK